MVYAAELILVWARSQQSFPLEYEQHNLRRLFMFTCIDVAAYIVEIYKLQKNTKLALELTYIWLAPSGD